LEKLAVVLPTYNEADNIPELIERLESSLKGFDAEMIFLDDGRCLWKCEVVQRPNRELARKYGVSFNKISKIVRKEGLGEELGESLTVLHIPWRYECPRSGGRGRHVFTRHED